MTGARQIFLGSRRGPALPYDSRVEYLDIGVGGGGFVSEIRIDDNDFVLSCDMMVLGAPTASWARYFGTYTSESAASTRVIAYNSTTNLYVGYRRAFNSQTQWSSGSCIYSRFILELKYLSIRFLDPTSGARIAGGVLSAPSGSADTGRVALGSSTARFRCWGFHIAHSGVAVLDWIPVRVGTGGAMYDRITGALIQSSMPPTPGPDKTVNLNGGGCKCLNCFSSRSSARSTRLWKEAA